MKVILVGCGKSKWPQPCKARELYIGGLTKSATRYAESSGWPWGIVSALYGFMLPDQMVRPYDVTLSDLEPWERSQWASKTAFSIVHHFGSNSQFECHMGQQYLKLLGVALSDHGAEVEAPLSGLEVGQRLRWYKQRRAA